MGRRAGARARPVFQLVRAGSFRFEGDGQCDAVSFGTSGGSIFFDSDVVGTYHFICDLNQDGIFDLTSDVDLHFIGDAVAGTNDGVVEMTTDGLSGNIWFITANKLGIPGFDGRSVDQADGSAPPLFPIYLNPPENALVLSADEKTSIQALDRTQKSLPLIKGRCGTMTHDYKRNGTTTLFAAIELGHGEVIATCMKRHRHQVNLYTRAMRRYCRRQDDARSSRDSPDQERAKHSHSLVTGSTSIGEAGSACSNDPAC